MKSATTKNAGKDAGIAGWKPTPHNKGTLYARMGGRRGLRAPAHFCWCQ